jgi:hypothetical protein
MPMLHGCTTLTLSTYCVEHELFVRALKESERTRSAAEAGQGAAPTFETATESVALEHAPF